MARSEVTSIGSIVKTSGKPRIQQGTGMGCRDGSLDDSTSNGTSAAYIVPEEHRPLWTCQRRLTVKLCPVLDKLTDVSAERLSELADELSALSKKQSKALQASAYIQMNAQEASEYDERRVRIGELCSILGRFKAVSNGKPL
jgi:hypothetical protein